MHFPAIYSMQNFEIFCPLGPTMVRIWAKLKLVNIYRIFSRYNFEKLIQTLVDKRYFRTRNVNPLSASPTKWSYILKQFVGNLPRNCMSVLDHFVGLALKGLMGYQVHWVNPFLANILILYPQKIPGKPKIFCCFQVV